MTRNLHDEPMFRHIALQEGKRRGWFSYTDLDQLLETVDLAALAQVVVVVSAVCLTSYTASVLTLLGSVFAVSHMPGTSLSPRLPLQPATTQRSSSFDSLDELTSKDCATQTVTPVDVLTTSFILASIGSSNHNQSEAVDSSHQRSENYVNVCDVDKVENVFLQSNFYSWTVYFSNFAFSYLGFQEFHPQMVTSIPSYFTLFNENCTKELFNDVYEGEKEDKINHNSRFDVECDDATPDGILGEWTYMFQNWFEQESFGKHLQIQFFPLEITTY
ncbi:unnamed protein product [Timema podura]|uniref:Uncharacterized protein n=1 Tax=Timema podura TaxID=61482 RepID=A0ABN7P7G2_TIMPD|nr:unnamed protein product [Timema podura]